MSRCIVLLLFLASACGGNSLSPQPLPVITLPTPSVPPFSVSGTIVEHAVTGKRPLAGFHFTVIGSGVTASPLTVDVTTDANGRYEATGFPRNAWITVSLTGHRAPCPIYPSLLLSNSILNLDVVSDATLASTGIPDSLPTHSPTISGTVSETASAGGSPIEGALLELSYGTTPFDALVLASTLSDAAGRYFVCGQAIDELYSLRVHKNGYQPATQAFGVLVSARVDLELRR